MFLSTFYRRATSVEQMSAGGAAKWPVFLRRSVWHRRTQQESVKHSVVSSPSHSVGRSNRTLFRFMTILSLSRVPFYPAAIWQLVCMGRWSKAHEPSKVFECVKSTGIGWLFRLVCSCSGIGSEEFMIDLLSFSPKIFFISAATDAAQTSWLFSHCVFMNERAIVLL